MPFRSTIFFLILWLTLCPSHALAQTPNETENVHAELRAVNHNGQVLIGVHFEIKSGWHIYWENSGEAALATKVNWELPDGVGALALSWPPPYRFLERGDITTFGYRSETLLYSALAVSEEAAKRIRAGGRIPVGANVSWLVCKDICIPGRTTLNKSFELASSDETGSLQLVESPASKEVFSRILAQSALFDAGKDGIKIRALAETQIAYRGEKFRGALLLEDLAIGDEHEISKLVQIFPYTNDTVTPGKPDGGTLQGTAYSKHLITFPLAISSDAVQGTQRLDGILLVSSVALKGDESDLVIPWSLEVDIGPGDNSAKSATEVTSEEFAQLLGARVSAKPLSYRLHSFQDKPTDFRDDGTEPHVKGQILSLPLAILYAFLGGMILNLMPCVLPIISIKVMTFIGHADQPRWKTRLAAFSFSAGILFSFFALACCVIFLRGMGNPLGWGFQFQHPPFVFILTAIVFVLGLGFFDVYTVSLPFMRRANNTLSNLSPSAAKHFFDGVLATALATPCTAPLLAGALVVAFVQPAAVTFAIFLSIGAGLALPYAYLSTHPKLLAKLPAPGPWMTRFRQLMGMFLLLTGVWLLFVLHHLTQEGAVWTVAALLMIFFGFWCWGWAKEGGNARKAFVIFLLVGLISFFCFRIYPRIVVRRGDRTPAPQVSKLGEPSGSIDWSDYSAERVEQVLSSGRPVFIDFTAEWCITCKANEYFTIETEAVINALRSNQVTPFRADWTTGEERITRALKKYGGEGVPLYVILSPDRRMAPIVLSTLPSARSLIDAFKKASIGPVN